MSAEIAAALSTEAVLALGCVLRSRQRAASAGLAPVAQGLQVLATYIQRRIAHPAVLVARALAVPPPGNLPCPDLWCGDDQAVAALVEGGGLDAVVLRAREVAHASHLQLVSEGATSA